MILQRLEPGPKIGCPPISQNPEKIRKSNNQKEEKEKGNIINSNHLRSRQRAHNSTR